VRPASAERGLEERDLARVVGVVLRDAVEHLRVGDADAEWGVARGPADDLVEPAGREALDRRLEGGLSAVEVSEDVVSRRLGEDLAQGGAVPGAAAVGAAEFVEVLGDPVHGAALRYGRNTWRNARSAAGW
jgi:hypothetical protein